MADRDTVEYDQGPSSEQGDRVLNLWDGYGP